MRLKPSESCFLLGVLFGAGLVLAVQAYLRQAQRHMAADLRYFAGLHGAKEGDHA